MDLFYNTNINIEEFLNIKKYPKGIVVFEEGTTCNSLGYVLKGEVHISTFTLLEKEYSINTIKENEVFGEVLLFSDHNHYFGNVYTAKETIIGFIDKNKLLDELTYNQIFLKNFLNILTNKFLNLQQRNKILLQPSIKEKILFFLEEESKSTNSSVINITTKEQLALFLNIPRPSLSRELIILKNEGYIKYNRRSITLLKETEN